jgi:hypothetical protein
MPGAKTEGDPRLSEDLRRWSTAEGEKTVGTLSEAFGEKSFAVLFILLLAVPALPLPTGGATHVFEAIAMLLALQLLIGKRTIWLPARWRTRPLIGPRSERFVERLLRLIAWLERRSRPRGRVLFGNPVGNAIFGALVFVGSLAAFVAPPFSTLDTLPALGVVVLSVGVLMEDAVIAAAGLALGAGGVALVLALGRAAIRGIGDLF